MIKKFFLIIIVYFYIILHKYSCNFTGDLFEKEDDILEPSIWKALGTPELVKTQSVMRSRVINLADFIIPGHGPIFRVSHAMKEIVKNQIIE